MINKTTFCYLLGTELQRKTKVLINHTSYIHPNEHQANLCLSFIVITPATSSQLTNWHRLTTLLITTSFVSFYLLYIFLECPWKIVPYHFIRSIRLRVEWWHRIILYKGDDAFKSDLSLRFDRWKQAVYGDYHRRPKLPRYITPRFIWSCALHLSLIPVRYICLLLIYAIKT